LRRDGRRGGRAADNFEKRRPISQFPETISQENQQLRKACQRPLSRRRRPKSKSGLKQEGHFFLKPCQLVCDSAICKILNLQSFNPRNLETVTGGSGPFFQQLPEAFLAFVASRSRSL
jgi:hypothetical protein